MMVAISEESGGVNEIYIESPMNMLTYMVRKHYPFLQYASSSSAYSSPRWSYKINEDFYSTQSSATEVNDYYGYWLGDLNSVLFLCCTARSFGGDQICTRQLPFNFAAEQCPDKSGIKQQHGRGEYPDGSVVGVFSATDVDGDNLHYHFYHLGESPETLSV